jgi:hypothetical protein
VIFVSLSDGLSERLTLFRQNLWGCFDNEDLQGVNVYMSILTCRLTEAEPVVIECDPGKVVRLAEKQGA